MNINEMTREEFEDIERASWKDEVICDSIIIIPGRDDDIHDSGYRCMSFVAVLGDEPLCILGGGSDVLHMDGICGFGEDWVRRYGSIPDAIPPSGWSIDCLPKSGFLRVFSYSKRIKCGPSLSSFEIFAIAKDSQTKYTKRTKSKKQKDIESELTQNEHHIRYIDV